MLSKRTETIIYIVHVHVVKRDAVFHNAEHNVILVKKNNNRNLKKKQIKNPGKTKIGHVQVD